MPKPVELNYSTSRKPRNWVRVVGVSCVNVASVIVIIVGGFVLLLRSVPSSFPVAPSSVIFHFTNNSEVRIDSFVVTIPSGDVEAGPIAPGQTRDVNATAEHNFDYKYRAKVADHMLTGTIANWNDDDAQGPWLQHDISINPSSDGSIKIGPAIGH